MVVLGSLLLDIKMDTATLRSDVQKVTSHLTSMGQKLNSVYFGVSRMLMGYGIYQDLKQIVQITTEAQEAQLQLAAVLKSTGGAAGVSLREINSLAQQIQETTTLEEDAVQSAAAVLLQFGRVSKEVFNDAIIAATDLSARMKTDLTDSVLKIGKALQDPERGITALRRSGIMFSESQMNVIKNLVKANDLFGAQQIILKGLQTQFGGTAQALRHSRGGAITALMNNFKDIFEFSLQATKPIVDAIEMINEHFEYVTTGVKALAGALSTALIPAFTRAGSAILGVLAAIAKNPFTALVTGIVIAAGELVVFRDSIVNIGGTSSRVIDFVKAGWTNLSQTLGGVFKPLWEAMTHGFMAVWELIKGIAGMIGNIFKAVGGSVLTLLQGSYNITASIIKGILGLLSALGGPFKSVVDMVLLILQSIFGDVKSVLSAIWSLFLGLINKIIGGFVVIPKTVSVALGAIYENFKDVFSKLSNLRSSFWQGFIDIFTAGDFSFSAFRDSLK